MSQLTSNPVVARSKWQRRGVLAVVALIPLVFTGLVVGAVSQNDNVLESIPAAIVNEDSLITQTADDGTETNVFAGRQLVTELTGEKSTGFDWTITNADDAEEALANGEVYAILTVPSNFSKSILSIQGDDPERANISIETDDSHSYITGAVAQVVGESMASTFGNEITKQYISGIYASFGDVGSSLQDAADGAGKLEGGANDLGDGLDTLADGADSAATGATTLTSGLTEYTGGVGSLSDGLAKLAKGDNDLTKISDGVSTYTGAVTELSTGLDQINAVIQAYPNVDARTKAALKQIADGLGQTAESGPALASGAETGISGIQSGITQSAAGAKQLDKASAALVSGSGDLADGLGDLADGAATAADGAGTLADGAGTLADGLSTGADAVPSLDDDQATASADVASDPVSYTVTTNNAVTDVGQAVATVLVPLGLWIGALAVFLVLRPITRRSLASTATNRRLVFSVLSRASAVTAIQAALLVALLHLVLKVDWSLLPLTLPFALVTALAFTAFHYLLTIGLGRAGLVISLILLAFQLTSTGGLYPIELLAAPFQMISPFMPLTYGVSGMQGILSGGAATPIVTAFVVLALFGIGSTLLALVAIRRTRRAAALGIVPATA
jgi:putative membrane protein